MTKTTEIQTNGRTLVVVPVPEDSDNHTLYWKFTYQLRYETTLHHDCSIKLSDILDKKEEYRVLGYLTKDEISFDVESYVEGKPNCYKDYVNSYLELPMNVFTKEESFRSLLESNNIYFTNPKGGTPTREQFEHGWGGDIHVDDALKKWNEAQAHVIEKCVILEKIKNL